MTIDASHPSILIRFELDQGPLLHLPHVPQGRDLNLHCQVLFGISYTRLFWISRRRPTHEQVSPLHGLKHGAPKPEAIGVLIWDNWLAIDQIIELRLRQGNPQGQCHQLGRIYQLHIRRWTNILHSRHHWSRLGTHRSSCHWLRGQKGYESLLTSAKFESSPSQSHNQVAYWAQNTDKTKTDGVKSISQTTGVSWPIYPRHAKA